MVSKDDNPEKMVAHKELTPIKNQWSAIAHPTPPLVPDADSSSRQRSLIQILGQKTTTTAFPQRWPSLSIVCHFHNWINRLHTNKNGRSASLGAANCLQVLPTCSTIVRRCLFRGHCLLAMTWSKTKITIQASKIKYISSHRRSPRARQEI